MNLDDSALNVGMPLCPVNRTAAPHAFVPAFLLINTVLVVVSQMRVSTKAEGPRRAARVVVLYELTMLVCCAVLGLSVVQRGACLRRMDAELAAAGPNVPSWDPSRTNRS